MGKGRKRKAGKKRTRSGRISYSNADRLVKGNIRAQAMQALYGTDGADALGRAFRHGLLGSGSEAKNLLDTGRRIANIYWQAYEDYPATCTLSDRVHGSNSSISPEDARRREEWLNDALATVNALGRAQRACFDQLVIDVHPDHGPPWLDRLIMRERGQRIESADRLIADNRTLRAAVAALATIAG